MKTSLKKKIAFISATTLCAAAMTISANAANYKFSFNLTTKVFHGAVHTDPATKYTKTEDPVIHVKENTSGALMQYTVVNSDDKARTDTITTENTGKWTFTNNNTVKGYRYRVRIKTDTGNIWNTYTVAGAWNIDTY